MRKAMTLILALGFVVALSGIALAGGMGEQCSYGNHSKQVTADKLDVSKPVAKKAAPQTETDKPLLALKDQPNKPADTKKK